LPNGFPADNGLGKYNLFIHDIFSIQLDKAVDIGPIESGNPLSNQFSWRHASLSRVNAKLIGYLTFELTGIRV